MKNEACQSHLCCLRARAEAVQSTHTVWVYMQGLIFRDCLQAWMCLLIRNSCLKIRNNIAATRWPILKLKCT